MSYELISDLYKDVTGSRPDTAFFDAFQAQTEVDKATQWNTLCDMLADREAQTREDEADAQLLFNNRMAGMMADYSIDWATALRWDMESFDTMLLPRIQESTAQHEQEIEHYLFQQGIAPAEWPPYVALLTAQ